MTNPEKEKDKEKLKARNWVFTLNNPCQEDIDLIANPYEEVKYIAYSHEVGKKGTPHLQGFVCMWEPVRLTFFKKYLPRAHMDVMHGRILDNVRYCSKQSNGELIEFGERPAQGRRTDLIGVKRRLDDGARPMDLAEEENLFPIIAKHDRFFDKYAQHVRAKRVKEDRCAPEVYIRIGAPGTGKTRWLDEQYGLSGWVRAPDNTGRWFDGCDHDVVCFDDVGPGEIMGVNLFKTLTDRYPRQVPVKGGFIVWKPKVIVFTSNQHWNSWWKDITPADREAVERRITSLVVV